MKKNVKRLICIWMMGVMMVMLGACGGAGQQTVTCKLEQNGVVMELTMEAMNDIITKWIQTSTISLGEFDEATQAALKAATEQSEAIYAAYDKVTYAATISTDGVMVEVITIDMTDSDTIKSLAEAGLMPVTGNARKISLKKTVESLKSQGYTVEQ